MDDERVPIIIKERNGLQISGHVTTAVYKRRWWIMAVVNLASVVQTVVWNTWGPLAESSEIVFGWEDSTIALLTNLDNVFYILFALPITMFMDTKGLRASMIICSSTLVVGTAIRCVSTDPEVFTIMSYVCACLNGIAGVPPFAGPALIAAVWFPPEQRTTATAIASFFNYFGIGFAFLLGPWVVTDPVYFNENSGSDQNISKALLDLFSNNSRHDLIQTSKGIVMNADTLRSGIMNLIYLHCGLAVLLFLLTVVYFPSHPPLPPSKTASIQRTDFKQALGKILRNGPLWLVVIAFSLPIGVIGCWATVLDVNVKPLGVSQTDAGWMGFLHTFSGCLSGLIIARFSDIFMRRRKKFLIGLFLCASVSCVFFALLCEGVLPFSLPGVYVCSMVIGACTGGSIPLFYEIAAEASYPVAEGVTGGFLTLVNCTCGVVFLAMFSIPDIGTTWMNWALLGTFIVTIPILIVFPEKFNRMDIDMKG